MAETILVTPVVLEPLSDRLREEGQRILAKLDDKDAQITSAFWLHLEEEETWRLYLATPLTDTKGPLFVYKLVQEVLEEVSSFENGIEIRLMNIAVVSPDLLLVLNMHHRYGQVEKENMRQARRIDAPYIYRLV